MSTKIGTVTIWIAAFFLTVTLAVFQRMTGPSYPLRGEVAATGGAPGFATSLPRSHGGEGGLEVTVEAPPGWDGGALEWRRYPTADDWSVLPMARGEDGAFSAVVPHQPPAGKVEYRILLTAGVEKAVFPADEPAVARFRGDVPAWVLIPHILAMFSSMLVSSRALLEAVRPSTPDPRWSVVVAMGLLIVGGLILGPIVQKFAFGEFWTGWPNGSDLTDNKTLIAFLAWLPVTVLALRGKRLRTALVLGWLAMMGAFLIPHSLRGSEMDWSEGEIKTGQVVERLGIDRSV
ncbi:MAG: hypothetical protein V2I67_11770 [Thermoanaerobaculales bacterium]|jgi:hypothetical protein|nr:hypothetical protein [Thermoanaerobaculales bacterium]